MNGHLISRPAYTTPCPACSHQVIVAMDGGLTINATAQPVSAAAEIAARLSGHGAYDLLSTPGGKTWLATRDIFRTRAGREYPVITDHQCAVRIPWRIPPARGQPPVKRPAVKSGSGDEPLF